MQNKDPDLEVQQDDLMFLHSQYGEPFHLNRRMAIGAIGGVAYGALIALIIKELLFNGNLESRSDEIFFYALLGFFIGTVKPVFRGIELLIDDRRSKNRDPSGEQLTLLEKLSGIGLMSIIVGLLLFIPLGFTLFLLKLLIGSIGWFGGFGMIETAFPSILLAALMGLSFALSFGKKRLKVFTDVEHLYHPQIVDPLPQAAFSYDHETQLNENDDLEVPTSLVNETVSTAGDTSEDSYDNLDDQISEESYEKPSESSQELFDYRFRDAFENVPITLTVVASSARPKETVAFLSALRRDAGEDVLRIKTVADNDPNTENPKFWNAALETKDALYETVYCVVLMTTDLTQSHVPNAIKKSIDEYFSEQRKPEIYPVLVDKHLDHEAPLMDLQDLPTDQRPVENWPIRDNAWKNVSRNLLSNATSSFFSRLNSILLSVIHKNIRSRYKGFESLRKMEAFKWEEFVNPRYDFRYFSFRKKKLYFSFFRSLLWAAVGSICFGVIGTLIIMFFELKPTSSQFIWSI